MAAVYESVSYEPLRHAHIEQIAGNTQQGSDFTEELVICNLFVWAAPTTS